MHIPQFLKTPTLFAPRPVVLSYLVIPAAKFLHATLPPLSEQYLIVASICSFLVYFVCAYFILVRHFTIVRFLFSILMLFASMAVVIASIFLLFTWQWGLALCMFALGSYFTIGGVNLLYAKRLHPQQLGLPA